MTERPTVLVVDDKPDVADTYSIWLQESYDVRTAYGGYEALELLDEGADVDVVLLDRRMPGLHGDEVLESIRSRNPACRIAMVTAVEPDFDIIEMGFDTYLVKPVFGDDLHGTIEQLLTRASYEDGVREYFALASKRAVLEDEKTERELSGHDEYDDLLARINSKRAELDSAMGAFESDDYTAAFRDLGTDVSDAADGSDDGDGSDGSGQADVDVSDDAGGSNDADAE